MVVLLKGPSQQPEQLQLVPDEWGSFYQAALHQHCDSKVASRPGQGDGSPAPADAACAADICLDL